MPRTTKNSLTRRKKGARLTPAQQEAVVRIYFTNGNYSKTARELGLSIKAVKNAIEAAQNDPVLMAHRGDALDQLAGKIHGVTDEVLESITSEELQTERHHVYDTEGNLLRVVTSGPTLRDKALLVGIFTDKQSVLQKARAEATEYATAGSGDISLMLPEHIDDKRRLIMQKVKRMRIMDVEFDTGETGKTLNMALNRVGITEDEIEEADVVEVGGLAPFD